MTDEDLIEALADKQHEIWTHWMKYLFGVSRRNDDGTVTIPADKVERWKRQMATTYADLSQREQDSDRHQAQKIMDVLGDPLHTVDLPLEELRIIIDAIEARLRELAEVISQGRQAATPVRLRTMPLGIEVPHPNQAPLAFAMPSLKPHIAALGKSFDYKGDRVETIDLTSAAHVLVACCKSCNSRKHGRTPEQAGMVLLDLPAFGKPEVTEE